MNLTLEAVVYGLVFALRLLVVALACLLVVCARRPRRAADLDAPHLAALGADRAARDAASCPCSGRTRSASPRRSAAARTEARAGRADGWRCCARRSRRAGALARRRRRARDARLRRGRRTRARGPALDAGRAAARSRHDLAFGCAAVAIPLLVVLADLDGARRLPRLPARLGRHRPGHVRARLCCCSWRRCCRSSTAGGSSHERAALRARLLPLPGRGGGGAARRQLLARARASSACSRAAPGPASRRCCAPRRVSCRTSTAARFAGQRHRRRPRHPRAARPP